MKEFISQNLVLVILLLFAVIIFCVLLFGFRGRYKNTAKKVLLALVLAAEQKYGGGTGKLKFAYVSEKLYEMMPKIFRMFFTSETIGVWIEEAVTKMKEYFGEYKIENS